MTKAVRIVAGGIGLLFAIVPITTFADSNQPSSRKVDPAAQARAQALIDSVENGKSIFRSGELGEVIHIQSGMSCSPGSQKMTLIRVVVTPATTPGDDVACDYQTAGGKTTIFAVRIGANTLEGYAADVLSTLAKLYPDAKPTSGPMILSYPNISTPHARALAIKVDGKPYITSVWISQERGWLVVVRATYPAEPRHDPEFLAAAGSMFAQKSIHDHAPD